MAGEGWKQRECRTRARIAINNRVCAAETDREGDECQADGAAHQHGLQPPGADEVRRSGERCAALSTELRCLRGLGGLDRGLPSRLCRVLEVITRCALGALSEPQQEGCPDDSSGAVRWRAGSALH